MIPTSSNSGAPTRHIVLLQALAAAPVQAAEAAAQLPPAAHNWQPAEEAWSAHALLAHLAAAELPFLYRLKRIRDEENPLLPYFGPDVAEPKSPLPLPRLLGEYHAERAHLLNFLTALAPEAWGRPAVHETQGATTLAQQVQNIVHHDNEHLTQLRALCQAWESRGDA